MTDDNPKGNEPINMAEATSLLLDRQESEDNPQPNQEAQPEAEVEETPDVTDTEEPTSEQPDEALEAVEEDVSEELDEEIVTKPLAPIVKALIISESDHCSPKIIKLELDISVKDLFFIFSISDISTEWSSFELIWSSKTKYSDIDLIFIIRLFLLFKLLTFINIFFIELILLSDVLGGIKKGWDCILVIEDKFIMLLF